MIQLQNVWHYIHTFFFKNYNSSLQKTFNDELLLIYCIVFGTGFLGLILLYLIIHCVKPGTSKYKIGGKLPLRSVSRGPTPLNNSIEVIPVYWSVLPTQTYRGEAECHFMNFALADGSIRKIFTHAVMRYPLGGDPYLLYQRPDGVPNNFNIHDSGRIIPAAMVGGNVTGGFKALAFPS